MAPAGSWGGPIETDPPFAVPDEPAGEGWMVPISQGLRAPAHPAPAAACASDAPAAVNRVHKRLSAAQLAAEADGVDRHHEPPLSAIARRVVDLYESLGRN